MVISSLTGCISMPEMPERLQLYGIEVRSESYDDRFVRKSSGGYNYLPSKMNSKIYAFGALTGYGDRFRISIYNTSNKPINSNYFSDKFELFTKDGKQYILEAGSITGYPKGHINPDDNAIFYVDKPKGLKRESNIAKIVVRLGYETRIVLKPDLKTSK